MNCDFRQHLAVQGDASLLAAVHELGVVDAVHLACSGNTSDPQLTELSLLLLSADVSIVTGLHDSLFCHLEVLALAAPVALCQLQCLISSLASHHCTFNTCHSYLPPLFLRFQSKPEYSCGLEIWHQLFQCRCVCAVSDTNGTSDSLSLGILLCQSVSFVGLLILYLSGSSHLKTLLCTGMSLGLDLCHCEFLLFTSMPSVK